MCMCAVQLQAHVAAQSNDSQPARQPTSRQTPTAEATTANLKKVTHCANTTHRRTNTRTHIVAYRSKHNVACNTTKTCHDKLCL